MAEMMQCMATSASDLSVLQRQSARLQWQQQEQQQSLNYITGAGNLSSGQSPEALLSFPLSQHQLSSNFQPISEHDPLGGLGLRWPDLSAAGYPVLGFGPGECIGSMLTRKDEGREALATQGRVMAAAAQPSPKQSSDNGGISLRKRKAENPPASKADDCNVEKKLKRDAEAVATMTETKLKEEPTNDNKRETSDESSKEKSKASTAVAAASQKTDYIHVRARRGQATDSHSLAERVRREKISERMRYLQDLVPGCNKITGKAGMLDEIINYVQSLQRQVEFLSMKLAAVNPRLDFNVDHFFSKEMNPSCSTSISTVGMSCEMIDPSYLQLNSLQQSAACCGIDMAMSPPELVLRRSMSSLVSAPDTLLDPCFDVVQGSSTWGTDLHSLYNVEFHPGKGAAFPLQSFHGNLLPNNLKMEM